MSLKAAKQLYTKKKNSLNRIIEQIQAFLADLSVGAERLEEVRGGLRNAWEAFHAAYDGLVEIQLEDDTQAADKQERDEEQGNFEVRVLGLQSELTGVIVQRKGNVETTPSAGEGS